VWIRVRRTDCPSCGHGVHTFNIDAHESPPLVRARCGQPVHLQLCTMAVGEFLPDIVTAMRRYWREQDAWDGEEPRLAEPVRWVSPHALAFRCPACGAPLPVEEMQWWPLWPFGPLAPLGPVTSELHGIDCGRPTRASAGGALVPAARWAMLRGVNVRPGEGARGGRLLKRRSLGTRSTCWQVVSRPLCSTLSSQSAVVRAARSCAWSPRRWPAHTRPTT